MNALLDWENDLENLTKSVDGALKSIEQNDELGDLEKAEARLNKLDKIMDAFGPVNRLEQILVPSIQAYHELIECSRVPNVLDAAEQVLKDLTDRTGALSHQLVGLNRLKFQLQREIKLQKAAQLHLPIALMVNSRDSFSSSSCDSQVETDFLSKIGSTLAFLTYSIYEYARSLDIQEQQPKEELERLEQKMSAFEFEMALLREGLSQCNSNALELSSIIQEMKAVPSVDLEKQKTKVEVLTHQVDEAKSTYYQKALKESEGESVVLKHNLVDSQSDEIQVKKTAWRKGASDRFKRIKRLLG